MILNNKILNITGTKSANMASKFKVMKTGKGIPKLNSKHISIKIKKGGF